METTRRSSYDSSFKLKAIKLTIQDGNRAAGRKLKVNESIVRRWRRQREVLMQCQMLRKAFIGHKSRWPELENALEDWVNTQKAKTVVCKMNVEDFKAGPSWCFRFLRQINLSIRGTDHSLSATPS